MGETSWMDNQVVRLAFRVEQYRQYEYKYRQLMNLFSLQVKTNDVPRKFNISHQSCIRFSNKASLQGDPQWPNKYEFPKQLFAAKMFYERKVFQDIGHEGTSTFNH